MAKLQPSLLDRLTDLSPEKEKESASQQMVGSRQYKAAVIRDLGWLLNSVSLESVFDLEPYPYVRKSVVNYGLPDISGHTANSIDTFNLEHELQKAICEFEPRILPNTLRVNVHADAEEMSHNSLEFIIEGLVFEEPVPFQVALRSRLDLESGDYQISEDSD